MTAEYTFVAPDRQNELTRAIQAKLVRAAKQNGETPEKLPAPDGGRVASGAPSLARAESVRPVLQCIVPCSARRASRRLGSGGRALRLTQNRLDRGSPRDALPSWTSPRPIGNVIIVRKAGSNRPNLLTESTAKEV